MPVAPASTGFEVVADGDAHLQNFGVFASPERTLVFDLNDFDEAGVVPREWDVKRLAVSAHLGARSLGADAEGCARRRRRPSPATGRRCWRSPS